MKAVYAGSFDPLTLGHLYIYNQAKELFDNVTILIATNPNKKKYFNESNMYLGISNISNVDNVLCYNGLIADYCKEGGIKYLIRGLRNTSDYMYEEEVAKINQEIYPELKTIYFRAKDAAISSTMVRLLHEQGKDIRKYVPKEITDRILLGE